MEFHKTDGEANNFSDISEEINQIISFSGSKLNRTHIQCHIPKRKKKEKNMYLCYFESCLKCAHVKDAHFDLINTFWDSFPFHLIAYLKRCKFSKNLGFDFDNFQLKIRIAEKRLSSFFNKSYDEIKASGWQSPSYFRSATLRRGYNFFSVLLKISFHSQSDSNLSVRTFDSFFTSPYQISVLEAERTSKALNADDVR